MWRSSSLLAASSTSNMSTAPSDSVSASSQFTGDNASTQEGSIEHDTWQELKSLLERVTLDMKISIDPAFAKSPFRSMASSLVSAAASEK